MLLEPTLYFLILIIIILFYLTRKLPTFSEHVSCINITVAGNIVDSLRWCQKVAARRRSQWWWSAASKCFSPETAPSQSGFGCSGEQLSPPASPPPPRYGPCYPKASSKLSGRDVTKKKSDSADVRGDKTDVPGKTRDPITCGGTFFAGFLVALVEQQEFGRLGQEGEADELKQRSETAEAEQPGPSILCAK